MNTLLLLSAIAVRTAIVLAAVGLGVRVMNKRHVGEARMQDILLILMAANGVQNAMTTGSGRLSVALVSAATLLFTGWLGAVVFERSPLVARRLGARPVVIVHNGTLLRRNLRRQRIDEDEVASAVRKQGVLHVADVKLAVLETNGSISVVPRDDRKRES